jgi:hypothetical protein
MDSEMSLSPIKGLIIRTSPFLLFLLERGTNSALQYHEENFVALTPQQSLTRSIRGF